MKTRRQKAQKLAAKKLPQKPTPPLNTMINLHKNYNYLPTKDRNNVLKFLNTAPLGTESNKAYRICNAYYSLGHTAKHIAKQFKMGPKTVNDIVSAVAQKATWSQPHRGNPRDSKMDKLVDVVEDVITHAPPLEAGELGRRVARKIKTTMKQVYRAVEYIGWTWKMKSLIVNCDTKENMEQRLQRCQEILDFLDKEMSNGKPNGKKIRKRILVWFDQCGFKAKLIRRNKVCSPPDWRAFSREPDGWGTSQANIALFSTRHKVVHIYFHKAPEKDNSLMAKEFELRYELYLKLKNMWAEFVTNKVAEMKAQAARPSTPSKTPKKSPKKTPAKSVVKATPPPAAAVKRTPLKRKSKFDLTSSDEEIEDEKAMVVEEKPTKHTPKKQKIAQAAAGPAQELVQLPPAKVTIPMPTDIPALPQGMEWGKGNFKMPHKVTQKTVFKINPITAEMTFYMPKTINTAQKMGITAEIMTEEFKKVVELIKKEEGDDVEVVMIGDNAPVHDQEMLKTLGAVWLPLPKYSPELNLAEHLFSALKAFLRTALQKNISGRKWESVLEEKIQQRAKVLDPQASYKKTMRLFNLLITHKGSLEHALAAYRQETKDATHKAREAAKQKK